MSTVVISFFILFGSSYGISSVLLKKNIKVHDPSYRPQIISTRVLSVSKSKDDWFV